MSDICPACCCRKVYCRTDKEYHCQCGWSQKRCRVVFRQMLNRESAGHTHREKRYHQKTRLYGDYLWHQDRERFEVDFKEWREAH